MCKPSIWITSRSSLDRSEAIHSGHPLRRQRHEPARGRRLRGAVPGDGRQVPLGQPHRALKLARRHVDQHQVHRPAAKPVLGLRRRPARQAQLRGRRSRAPAGDAPTTLPPWKPILPWVLPQRWPTRPPPRLWRGPASRSASSPSIPSMRSDPGRQAEALERAVHMCQARKLARAYRLRRGNIRHGVALLCGFDTPSLTAQGGQRLPP